MSEQPVLPAITLILGEAGSGKSQWINNRFCENAERSLLLVPSPRHAETIVIQLATQMGVVPEDIRGRIHTFQSLTQALLQLDLDTQWSSIGRAFQRLALTELLPNALHPDGYFGKMLHLPGFVPAFLERLREWKLAGATPQTLRHTAQNTSSTAIATKLNELAKLWERYDDFLSANHLRDEEDGLWRAIYLLETGVVRLPARANLLLIDGFYRFTLAQRKLMTAHQKGKVEPSEAEPKLCVTLLYDERRPTLFAASNRTLQTLRAEFAIEEIVLNTPKSDHNHAPMVLNRNLFTDVLPSKNATPTRFENPIVILDTPNPYAEAEMVARTFRRIQEAKGWNWRDFAVILRTMGDYAPILTAVFERYGIPIEVDGPEKLVENPVIKTVLAFLDTLRHHWSRTHLLDFLKSSYTPPDKLEVDALRRAAQARAVRSGREKWLSLAESVQSPILTTLTEMAEIETRFTAKQMEMGEFVAILNEAINKLGIRERLEYGETWRMARDQAALFAAIETLTEAVRIASLRSIGPISFTKFHQMLTEAWRNGSAMGSLEGDRVRVTEPYDARETPVRVAAVMGLMERVFPRRITEDPFLRDDERRLIRDETGIAFEEQQGRADDERLLFYMAITAPSERLLLSFPRATKENDTLPSFYLDEVRLALSSGLVAFEPEAPPLVTISRTLSNVAANEDDSVTVEDRLLSACFQLFDSGADNSAEARQKRLETSMSKMREHLANPEIAQLARSVLKSRCLPPLPSLDDEAHCQHFVQDKEVYPIKDLETYALCPFQYLVGSVWKTRPDGEGVGSHLHGLMYRATLRRWHRKKIANSEASPKAPYAETLRAELETALEEVLEKEEIDATPLHLRLLHRRLREDLDGFAIREAIFGRTVDWKPTYFQLSFGSALVSRGCDPQSCVEPLILTGVSGRSVAVSGIIDRVDMDSTGKAGMTMLVTTGSAPEFDTIQRSDSLMPALSNLALERLYGKIPAGFWCDSTKTSGRHRFFRVEYVPTKPWQPLPNMDDPAQVKPLNREQYTKIVKLAEETAVATVEQIERASVVAKPGTHCNYCAYRDVCRTSLAEGHDGAKHRPQPSKQTEDRG